MKEISKYLYDFLDSEFFQKHSINKKKNKQNKKNLETHFQSSHENIDSVVTKLIEDIQHANQIWNVSNNTTIQESILPNNMNKEQIPKGNMYYVIPAEAQQRIETLSNCGRRYVFTLEHQTIELVIIYFFSENDPTISVSSQKMDAYFKECLYKVYLWLSIAYKQKHSECSQTLKIFLYLTDLFKLIPEKKENIIDQVHANTAFTTPCAPSTEINIFREEEWFKVFIHESFHCLGFDFSHLPQLCETSKSHMLQIFPVKSDVNLFETWCEMWGELFNIIIYVTTHNMGTPIPQLLKKIKHAIKYEQMFSMFQCVKVLYHQELYYKDILRGSNAASIYSENTNVLSYYIIKSIFMFFIDDFFLFMKKNNQSSLIFLNTMENIEEYCSIIKKKYNNSEYLFVIHKIEEWYSSVTDYGIENITLRMTVLEW